MPGETTTVLLSRASSPEEMEEMYESFRQKAPLQYPKLTFRRLTDTTFEVGFHAKFRHWTGIDQYKQLVQMAIARKYPDVRVL